MFESIITKNLKSDESQVDLLREHWLIYWWQYLIALILILLPFFFLYVLFSYQAWGILVFTISIILGILVGFRAIYIYSLNAVLITNQRIINFNRKGLFNLKVQETAFDNIIDISYNKKGIFATILKYGDIDILTDNENQKFCLNRIKNPDKIREKLASYQKNYSLKNKSES